MRIIAGVDIETTDLDWTAGAKIMELGILFFDLDTRNQIGKWVQRINPECPVGAKALAVHGITFDAVSSCPKFRDIAPKAAALLARAEFWVAHNGDGFDFPFLKHEFMAAGITMPERPSVDTMLEGRWATFSGKFPNLGELCFACDVPYSTSEAHAAEYDIDRMMLCYFAAQQKGFFSLPNVTVAAPAPMTA